MALLLLLEHKDILKMTQAEIDESKHSETANRLAKSKLVIIEQWEAQVRAKPSPKKPLRLPVLKYFISFFIDQLTLKLSYSDQNQLKDRSLKLSPDSISQAVGEFHILRKLIVKELEQQGVYDRMADEIIHDHIDQAVHLALRSLTEEPPESSITQNEAAAMPINGIELYEAVFQGSALPKAIYRGPTFIFEKVNASFQALMPDRDLLGKRLLEVLPELADSSILRQIKKVYETGEPVIIRDQSSWLKKNNSHDLEERFFDSIYTRLTDHNGEIFGVFNYAIDVTCEVYAKRKIEASRALLRQTQEQLASAVKLTNIGFFEWDISTNRFTLSDQMRKDWAITSDITMDELRSKVHPEDRESNNKLIDEAISEQKPYISTFRVIHPDGRIIWIDACGELADKNGGRGLRFFGTSLDITKRKEKML